MIKFTAAAENGRTLVGLGISAGNVECLKQGKPIHVHFEELRLPYKIDLMVFFGETEQAMEKAVSEFIGPQTVVHRGVQKQ